MPAFERGNSPPGLPAPALLDALAARSSNAAAALGPRDSLLTMSADDSSDSAHQEHELRQELPPSEGAEPIESHADGACSSGGPSSMELMVRYYVTAVVLVVGGLLIALCVLGSLVTGIQNA